jgi:hypothetical protein
MSQNNNKLFLDIISSLRNGTVPSEGTNELAVGIDEELDEVFSQLNSVKEKKSAFKFIVGDYGSGKTFLSTAIKEMAFNEKFVVSSLVISKDTPFHKFDELYKKIMENLRIKEDKDIPAFSLILEEWLLVLEDNVSVIEGLDPEEDFEKFQEKMNEKIEKELSSITSISSSFTSAICKFYEAKYEGNSEISKACISWLKGEKIDAQIRSSIGITDNLSRENALSFLKALLYITKTVGYQGLVVSLDELETIQAIPRKDIRNMAYENLRLFIDETDKNNFPYCYFLFTGTNELMESEKGFKSLEPLYQRIKVKKEKKHKNLRQPVIYIEKFNENKLIEVAKKVIKIHEKAYKWNSESKIPGEFVVKLISEMIDGLGKQEKALTPRGFIRVLVDILDKSEIYGDYLPSRDFTFNKEAEFIFEEAEQTGGMNKIGYLEKAKITQENTDEKENLEIVEKLVKPKIEEEMDEIEEIKEDRNEKSASQKEPIDDHPEMTEVIEITEDESEESEESEEPEEPEEPETEDYIHSEEYEVEESEESEGCNQPNAEKEISKIEKFEESEVSEELEEIEELEELFEIEEIEDQVNNEELEVLEEIDEIEPQKIIEDEELNIIEDIIIEVEPEVIKPINTKKTQEPKVDEINFEETMEKIEVIPEKTKEEIKEVNISKPDPVYEDQRNEESNITMTTNDDEDGLDDYLESYLDDEIDFVETKKHKEDYPKKEVDLKEEPKEEKPSTVSPNEKTPEVNEEPKKKKRFGFFGGLFKGSDERNEEEIIEERNDETKPKKEENQNKNEDESSIINKKIERWKKTIGQNSQENTPETPNRDEEYDQSMDDEELLTDEEDSPKFFGAEYKVLRNVYIENSDMDREKYDQIIIGPNGLFFIRKVGGFGELTLQGETFYNKGRVVHRIGNKMNILEKVSSKMLAELGINCKTTGIICLTDGSCNEKKYERYSIVEEKHLVGYIYEIKSSTHLTGAQIGKIYKEIMSFNEI